MKYFTKEWYEKVQNNDDKSIKTTEKTITNYQKYEKKAFKKNKPNFLNDFVFHDAKIISSQKNGDDFIIKLDNSNSYTTINKITFKNCRILKQERDLKGSWWLYEEIYCYDQDYEICILLSNDESEVFEFAVLITDINYN